MRTTRRTMRLAAACATATLMAAGTATSASAAEVYPRPADGTLDFSGRGYGHGHGMSQYGAMNAAKQGRSWEQIIAHYYPGTAATKTAPTQIRVGVEGHLGRTARVVAKAGLVATDAAGQRVSLATVSGTDPILTWEVAPPASGTSTTDATLWFRTQSGARKPLRTTTTGRWTISASDSRLQPVNAQGTVVGTYSGTLTGIRTGSTVQPVLTTWMETYVRQVVPFESPGSWPVQALAAQAVAARTYAYQAKLHPRTSTYDICDTQSCQVFGGMTNETTNSRDAAADSTGIVATYAGAPALTQFGSSNGGVSAYGSKPYLPGEYDAYETGLATTTNQWQTSVPVTTFERVYPQIGQLQSFIVLRRDGNGLWGGRVQSVRLQGSAGYVDLTGDQLRSLVGPSALRSTYFLPVN